MPSIRPSISPTEWMCAVLAGVVASSSVVVGLWTCMLIRSPNHQSVSVLLRMNGASPTHPLTSHQGTGWRRRGRMGTLEDDVFSMDFKHLVKVNCYSGSVVTVRTLNLLAIAKHEDCMVMCAWFYVCACQFDILRWLFINPREIVKKSAFGL